MGRAATSLFTATLILLAALTCALWWRSRTTSDGLALFVAGEGRAQVTASHDGRVCVALTNIPLGSERAWTGAVVSGEDFTPLLDELDPSRIQIYPPPDPAKVAAGGSAFGDGYLGFSFGDSKPAVLPAIADSQLVYVVLPHWSIAMPLLAWATWRLFGPAAERRRRIKRGLCLHCGYDVRASTDRCPECGTEFRPAVSGKTA